MHERPSVPPELLDQLSELGLTREKLALLRVCSDALGRAAERFFPLETAHNRTLAALSLLCSQPTEDPFFLEFREKVIQAGMTKLTSSKGTSYRVHATFRDGLTGVHSNIPVLMPDSIWPTGKGVYQEKTEDAIGEVIYLYPGNMPCGCQDVFPSGDCPICEGTHISKTYFDFPPDLKEKTLAVIDRMRAEGKYDAKVTQVPVSEEEFNQAMFHAKSVLGLDEPTISLLAFVTDAIVRFFNTFLPIESEARMEQLVTAFLVGANSNARPELELLPSLIKRVIVVKASIEGKEPLFGLKITFHAGLPPYTTRLDLPEKAWPSGHAEETRVGPDCAFQLYPYKISCSCPPDVRDNGVCTTCHNKKEIKSPFFIDNAAARVEELAAKLQESR